MKMTLPVPPSANRYWSIWRGRAVTSGAAHAFKLLVSQKAKVEGHRPIEGNVVVSVEWYRARKSGDLDNRLKCLLDALKGVAFLDDKQVVELHAFRRDDGRNPRVEVQIEAAK